jgi:hypothetical protein
MHNELPGAVRAGSTRRSTRLDMKTTNVDRSAIAALDGPRQLIVHDHPHRFAIVRLSDETGGFGLSWRSDSIEPQVVESDDRKVWVGVDQRVAAVDGVKESIFLSLALNSNLLQLLTLGSIVLALTETEVIAFNQDGSIRFIHGLPDLPDSAVIDGIRLRISLIDGNVLSVDSETGVLQPVT